MSAATLDRTRAPGKLPRRCALAVGALVVYGALAALVVLALYLSGGYPAGSGADSLFYVYRGDFLYRSITQEGNWYPLIDMAWYNGVQTWRYWSPLSAFILAGCQAVMGGSSMNGYLLMVGIFYLLSAISWLWIGLTHDRPWMGAFMGAIWFLLPPNSFMFFSEGVLARSMSMAVLPLFLVSVHDYLYRPAEKRWPTLLRVLLSFLVIIMSHLGWAGMLAIAILIYLVFYFAVHLKKEERVSVSPILLCMVLAVLIAGVWVYPSLQGGITSMNSSSIMKSYFQPLSTTINPFDGWLDGGSWNRWDNVRYSPYFGFASFLLGVFGVFFARREQVPGFATACAICFLTTTAVYPLLSLLPGSQYLWMLRFLPIALTFLFVSFFFWRSLKIPLQVLFCVLLAIQVSLAFCLISESGGGAAPDAHFSAIEEDALIHEGKEHASQRMSMVEPFVTIPEYVYTTAGYGEKRLPTSFGQGIQSAPNFTNIIQVNQAAQDGQFLYMFDRLLEMGNDAVIVPVRYLAPRYADPALLDAAAARVGYTLTAENGSYRLYCLKNAPAHFGVVSKYRAIAIGTGSNSIALGFPAVEETQNIWLDEYTFDQLKDYDVIYLSGFTYHDLSAAERLVTDLSEAGVRILIMADGIPADEHTGSKSFLGVSCNTVNFQNGYPALDTVIGTLYCDLFPEGYSKDWKTVYLNGLTDVWGTITDVPEGKMDFFGTGPNDNIVFIGLALTYHYSLTLDPAVGELLSIALDLSSQELPQRELVPLSVDYHDNVITVDSPRDNVNTTLAYHDIFRPDRELRVVNNMTVVDEGVTTIRLVYPHLLVGGALTALGLALTVGYLVLMKKRLKKLAQWEAEAAQASEDAPAEPAQVQEP